MKTASIITLAALAVSACSSENTTALSWRQPAGAFLDEGQFGNPTMNNIQAHQGGGEYIAGLNSRFSSEVEPTITFDFDSSRLDAASRATLVQQATWIRQFPEVRFRVYGHTDLVGSTTYNKALGMRRANTAVSFLVSQGIERSRLEAVVSFGETQPIIVSEGRERRNRRTVTEVTGFVQSNPALLNGKYADVIFREYVTSATSAHGTTTSQ